MRETKTTKKIERKLKKHFKWTWRWPLVSFMYTFHLCLTLIVHNFLKHFNQVDIVDELVYFLFFSLLLQLLQLVFISFVFFFVRSFPSRTGITYVFNVCAIYCILQHWASWEYISYAFHKRRICVVGGFEFGAANVTTHCNFVLKNCIVCTYCYCRMTDEKKNNTKQQ